MKLSIAAAGLALAFLVVFIALTRSQDRAKTTTYNKTTTYKELRSLSGCLQRTDHSTEYQLTTRKRATWKVKSDVVRLGDYAGKKVRVTGEVSDDTVQAARREVKAEATENGIGESSTEHGHMMVTRLKMLSGSCSR